MDDRTLGRNYYIVSSTNGTIGCRHEWTTSTRQSVAKRWVVDRECAACDRTERWLQLARPRSRR